MSYGVKKKGDESMVIDAEYVDTTPLSDETNGEPRRIGPGFTGGPGKDSIASKYSDEKVAKICAALAAGNPMEASARAGGISKWTLRRWCMEYEGVDDLIQDARAMATRAHVANLNKSVQKGNPLVSMWWLERMHPEEFGRVDRVDLLVHKEQADTIVRELAEEEGLDVSVEDVMRRYNALKKRGLPSGGRS